MASTRITLEIVAAGRNAEVAKSGLSAATIPSHSESVW
jgi:hypothetical protein